MYPVVGKSASNCGIGSVAVAVELATCPFSVPTIHQMLDSLEGYLDNIAAAATQTAATGGPLSL